MSPRMSSHQRGVIGEFCDSWDDRSHEVHLEAGGERRSAGNRDVDLERHHPDRLEHRKQDHHAVDRGVDLRRSECDHQALFALFTAPLILLTLGLFLIVINACMLLLTSWLAGLFDLGWEVDGFWTAVLGAIIISIVSFILNVFLPDPDD